MKIEIRSDDCAVISGYVNAVERRSKVLMRPGAPPFREIVKSGTFRKALDRGNPVELKLNHQRTLCDTGSGLELREDNVGLHASAVVTDRETVDAARSGKLTGWSFGFRCRGRCFGYRIRFRVRLFFIIDSCECIYLFLAVTLCQ